MKEIELNSHSLYDATIYIPKVPFEISSDTHWRTLAAHKKTLPATLNGKFFLIGETSPRQVSQGFRVDLIINIQVLTFAF